MNYATRLAMQKHEQENVGGSAASFVNNASVQMRYSCLQDQLNAATEHLKKTKNYDAPSSTFDNNRTSFESETPKPDKRNYCELFQPGSGREDPKFVPSIVYLDTDQAREGGPIACPSIAVDMAFYLLYSETPTANSIIQIIRHGASDWRNSRTPANMSTYENAAEPYNRNVMLKTHMSIENDFCGLMISQNISKSELAKMPASFRDEGFVLHKNIRDSIQLIADKVMKELPPCVARSFAFSRGLLTMCGCCRKMRDGKTIRFDLVDSHCRLITPGRKEGSAIWIQCYGVADAVHFLELLFPPATSLDSLVAKTKTVYIPSDDHSSAGEYVEIPEENDSHFVPGPMYTITVFAPNFKTPEESRVVALANKRKYGNLVQEYSTANDLIGNGIHPLIN